MPSPSASKTFPGVSPDFLQPGVTLFNHRYRLEKRLGGGGMGVVWLAMDLSFGKERALKFPAAITAWDEKELQQLRREVAAGLELRHDRLLATHDFAHEPPLAAVVMAYVDGQTLKEKLDINPLHYYEPDEVCPWLRDVVEALGYLHQEKGIVHRDLKPANVMVDGHDRAQLMDFGISQEMRQTILRHSLRHNAVPENSTLSYASPQQLKHLAATAEDDIYSFGALTYELLTGRPPFFDSDAGITFVQVQSLTPPPIADRRRELVRTQTISGVGKPIPRAWEEMVARCLKKKAEERPTLAQLEHVLSTGTLPPEWVPPPAPVVAPPVVEAKPKPVVKTKTRTGPSALARMVRWTGLLGLGGAALWAGSLWLASSHTVVPPDPVPVPRPKPKPTPPTPVIKRLSLEDAESFVKRYYAQGETAEGRKTRLDDYAPKVEFQYQGDPKTTQTLEDLRKEESEYSSKWPRQKYTIVDVKVRPSSRNGYDADVRFDYMAGNELQTNTGKRRSSLHFAESNGRFLVDRVKTETIGEDDITFDKTVQEMRAREFMRDFLASSSDGWTGDPPETFYAADGVKPYFDVKIKSVDRDFIRGKEQETARRYRQLTYSLVGEPDFKGLGGKFITVTCQVNAAGIRKDGTPVDVTVLQDTTIRFSNGGKALVTGVESKIIKAAGEL